MQVLRRNGGGLSGAPQDMITAADGLLQSDQSERWPYFWIQPRSATQDVSAVNSIAAPANDVVTELVKVIVPSGMRFILNGILATFQTSIGGGAVWIPGNGAILWTVDVNVEITSATTSLSGYGLPYLSGMKEPRGSFEFGPFPIQAYNVFKPYDVVRLKVLTPSTAGTPITPGDPNYISGGLFGWFDKLLG
jgi:hypothetical protein